MVKDEIKIDKIYKSETFDGSQEFLFHENSTKRPSWVKANLDKKVIFLKIIFKGEAFWYRRYFQDYFFIFDAVSQDYKNYYNEIAQNYESYIPQNKVMRKIILDFLEELKVNKNSKILDIGAGTGIVTEGIAQAGYNDLTLLDISDKELEIAKNKPILSNAKFQTVDLVNEEILGKFNVVFETMSLDYFKGEKLKLILSKIKNSLVKRGNIIIIDRHIYPEFNDYFKEIKKGKTELDTPEGKFDYYYFIGKN
ncbi:methyltransferase domain-containing protein [Patescibacteria group bacterium]|nr:methyltransferase domain-containing protein [Patescibacteria group bacterium]